MQRLGSLGLGAFQTLSNRLKTDGPFLLPRVGFRVGQPRTVIPLQTGKVESAEMGGRISKKISKHVMMRYRFVIRPRDPEQVQTRPRDP